MTELKTTPAAIEQWLGTRAIRHSDNLAIPGRVKAMRARILWTMGEVVPGEDSSGGPEDAA